MSNSWKAEERKIAAALGTVRNPSNGRVNADIDTPRFAIECKKRRSLPLWLRKALLQARAGCRGVQRPLTVLSLAPGRGVPIQRYVVLEWSDFLALAEPNQVFGSHPHGGIVHEHHYRPGDEHDHRPADTRDGDTHEVLE